MCILAEKTLQAEQIIPGSKKVRGPIADFLNRLRKDVKINWELYLYCIPGLVLLVIFAYIPLFNGVMLGFKDYKPRLGTNASPWIGLHNFKLFVSSYSFLQYVRNTLVLNLYSLCTSYPLTFCLDIIIDSLRLKKFKSVFQTISYAPHFISVVVVCGMLNLFTEPTGIINQVIAFFTGEPYNFDLSKEAFPHLLIWSGIWQGIGFGCILYVSALSAVSTELIEASRIDGASKLQQIWYIKIPTILPTCIITLIFAVGGLASSSHEKILLMQTPINLEVSEVIASYVYKVGMINSRYSFSAAVGFANSIVNFMLLTIANGFARLVSGTSLW